MALNFPSNPSENDIYQFGLLTYIYKNGKWVSQSRGASQLPWYSNMEQARAFWKRLAAEAGLNLVDGSFEEGAVLTGSNDVVWWQTGAAIYGWHLDESKTVAAGSTPTNIGTDWIDVTNLTLRNDLESSGILYNVKWFGASGLYADDQTSAISDADLLCSQNGWTLYFPDGRYRITNGIEKKARWVGAGAPVLGTFPITTDDKRFLRPGYKDKMPGATIFLSGNPTNTVTTQRTDRFSSFKYGIKDQGSYPSKISGIAICQDMDVFDIAGNITTWTTDNRASGYDVGYYSEDTTSSQYEDFVVFGYYNKAGIVIHSVEDADHQGDPDYNIFMRGSTSGDIGLAIIGSDSNDGYDSGLSGTQTYAFNIYAKDHHSRDNSVDDWGTTCLYIDGYTDATLADINGHFFNGGCIRTYGNNPISLGYATNTNFHNVIFETPKRGTSNSSATQFKATTNTRNVSFMNCRHSDDGGMYNAEFGGVLQGQLIVVGGKYGGITVTEKDVSSTAVHSVKIGGSSGGTGDPAIQLVDGTPSTSTSGWRFRKDISDSNSLKISIGSSEVAQITTDGVASFKRLAQWPTAMVVVSSGVISVTQAYHVIDATGSPTITTISGGVDGEIVELRKTGTGTVTVSEGGNIVTPSTSVVLTAISDVVILLKVGTNWIVQSFSDNA